MSKVFFYFLWLKKEIFLELSCTNLFKIVTGPELPIALYGHSMVPLGFGQIIIGGTSNGNNVQSKLYFLTCTAGNCVISSLVQELSVPRSAFMAIPISDTISGCISDRK